MAGAAGGLIFVRSVQRHGRIYALGPVVVDNRGIIQLGDRVVFVRSMIPARLSCAPGATLEVGDRTGFNSATVEAYGSIRIGRRCLLASGVRVCDKGPGGIAPIVIGDDVWLAHGVTIEPGVTVGNGSVVSAGSVVKRDVPPNSLAAGNPARSVSLALAVGRATPVEPV
jgi:maltose O-acetyltransferase